MFNHDSGGSGVAVELGDIGEIRDTLDTDTEPTADDFALGFEFGVDDFG